MFESAKLKLERANHHISDLRAFFDAFINSNPHTLRISSDPNGYTTIEMRFRDPITPTIPLVIGDAIHNLRAALDHATWELVGSDGGTQDRFLSFPMGQTQRDYEASCKGIKTPRQDTKDFFIRCSAYKGGGGDVLYALHLLDNVDKHTMLTPLAGASRVSLKAISADGSSIVQLTDCAVMMGVDGRSRLRVHAGWRVELDQKTNPTIEIFFRDVEGLGVKSIIPALMHFSNAVADCLRQFQTFVLTRE